jgi:hypothetical protein
MPSLSCWVQTGVIDASAALVSRHDRPAIEPESSIKKMVSKFDKKAYLLSVDFAAEAVGGVYAGGASEWADRTANGFATVAGFAGLLVGALDAAKGDDDGNGDGGGEVPFVDVFDTVLGVRLKREVLLDLRRNRLKEDILLEDESAHSEDAGSYMKGIEE